MVILSSRNVYFIIIQIVGNLDVRYFSFKLNERNIRWNRVFFMQAMKIKKLHEYVIDSSIKKIHFRMSYVNEFNFFLNLWLQLCNACLFSRLMYI